MNERDERFLNDYLDGGLSQEDRAALEVRLDSELPLLREYAALLDVVKAVGDLPTEAKLVDPDAIWVRIAERTGAGAGADVREGASVRSALGSADERSGWADVRQPAPARSAPRVRWFAPTLPRLAATLVLAALSGGGVWLALGAPGFGPSDEPTANSAGLVRGDPPVGPTSQRAGDSSESSDGSESSGGVLAAFASATTPDLDALFEGYESSTRVFNRVLEEGAATLSPETLDAVREALAVADQAIAEARRALEEDPGSEELARILFASMKRRLELLRSAATVVQSAAQ